MEVWGSGGGQSRALLGVAAIVGLAALALGATTLQDSGAASARRADGTHRAGHHAFVHRRATRTTPTPTPTTPSTTTPSTTTATSTTQTTTEPPSYDAVVAGDDPVAFWDVDQPGTTEPDLSGNGHAGTYLGGPHRLTTLPDGNAAVDFDGAGQYLSVPSSPSFSVSTTGALTWEAWIRPDTVQWSSSNDTEGYNYVDFMGKCQDYSPDCEWEARLYDSVNPQGRCNRISAYMFNPGAGEGSGADWQPSCGAVAAGQWLYVVGEYQTTTTPSSCPGSQPGSIDIWVDGVEWDADAHRPTGCMSQFGVTPSPGDSPLDIGTMALDTWFPGAIGKVAIYDHLLTQTQIDAHYTAMTGKTPSGSCVDTCVTSGATSSGAGQ